jgi:hypothetical protein
VIQQRERWLQPKITFDLLKVIEEGVLYTECNAGRFLTGNNARTESRRKRRSLLKIRSKEGKIEGWNGGGGNFR